MFKPDDKISAIILAGGEGKRLGGVDKGLFHYKNKALIEYVIDTITPQVDEIIISANRNQNRYTQYTPKVITDNTETTLGPMAGIAAALAHCSHDWVLVVACDTPFLPTNIIDTFLHSKADSKLYVAEADNKLQLLMLLHKSLHRSLTQALDENQLRLMRWVKSQQAEIVIFNDKAAFKNLNNIDDFAS